MGQDMGSAGPMQDSNCSELFSRIREIAAGTCTTAIKEVPAARAMCATLVDFEQLVASATIGSNTEGLGDLLRLCAVVATGLVDRFEDLGQCRGLELFGKDAHRAKNIAGLCQKGPFSRLARRIRKVSRDIEAAKNAVLKFAQGQHPELAIDEDVYVSYVIPDLCILLVCGILYGRTPNVQQL